ncbi:MFS transporter [Aspergillus pseudoustus]|uniref:MFS transporter n=1 Tax=Aspergillus pseudoustus TaxID=1810923 RepID=A0ABR4IQX3_9EURO
MATMKRQRTETRVDDPFQGILPDEVERNAREFHSSLQELHSVVDVELLVKGARLGKDAGEARFLLPNEQEILAAERAANPKGISGVMHQIEGLHATIMATACAAVALGWQQSAINTSAQTWPARFGLDSDSWRVAIINAAPSLSGSIIGTWISDPLQGFSLQKPPVLARFRFGRRFAMMLSGFVSIACCIWSARCRSWRELLICRVILGIGFGTKASVAPIFAAEAAMEKSRGRILMMWQLFDALGIMLGFVTALIAPHSWEVQLAAALIPSVALIVVVMLCPESPRLLIRKKRYAEAYKSLCRLRRLEIQAARDFYYIHEQLQQEFNTWRPPVVSDAVANSQFPCQDFIAEKNSLQRIFYLFTLKRNRRACVVSCLVMASQQLCGINVLAYYSSTVFRNAAELNAVNLMSFGFGAANFIFAVPAFFLIDSKGRRYILLISFLGMTASLLGASFCFGIADETDRIVAVSFTVIVLYTGFYSIGAGPVPFTLSAEIFPLAFREVGMSFSVMVNFLGLGLLVLFVPRITRRIGQRKVLFILMGLNAAMLILVYLIVPATKERTLEDMNELFEESTMRRAWKNAKHARNLVRNNTTERSHGGLSPDASTTGGSMELDELPH